jgi:hypothetical protein
MAQAEAEELSLHHRRIRERGTNPWVYGLARAFLKPFLILYFRMRRRGREHLPAGPVLQAANHRSFLDPFGDRLSRTSSDLLRGQARALRPAPQRLGPNALGEFPIKRGESDQGSMTTARMLLERGEARVEDPSPHLAVEVTARIWPCVESQWAWLGGPMPHHVEHEEGRERAAA